MRKLICRFTVSVCARRLMRTVGCFWRWPNLNDFSVAQAFTPGNEKEFVSKAPLMGL